MMVNGVYVDTAMGDRPLKNFGVNWRMGIDANGTTPYGGLISDFRIYSTCLSDADALALYQTPISLSSNGVLFEDGISESDTGLSFRKSGIISAESNTTLVDKDGNSITNVYNYEHGFIEDDSGATQMSLHEDYVLASEFIEI